MKIAADSMDDWLDLDGERRLHEYCISFEQAWKSGEPTGIESAVARANDIDQAVLLRELVRIDLEYRTRRGEAPTPDEYAGRFPTHAAVLRELVAHEAEATLASPDLEAGSAATVGKVSLPTEFGGYELLEEIGRGGMGVVYRARQRDADRIVALKLVLPGRLISLEAGRRNEVVKRFRSEAQAAAGLEHECIVRVYEVGECDGQPFYSMQYVPGQTLGQILSAGPLEPREAARHLEAVARGVLLAHQQGVLHRDLKPQNVLIDSSTGRPLVVDFGLAKLLEKAEGLTESGDFLGSPPYMSPEQIDDPSSVTSASDIYSLGATLYHLLTGRPPFQAASAMTTMRQILDTDVVPPRRQNSSIDRDLEAICLKCLEKDPKHRYPDAQALADDLSRFLDGEPVLARSPGRVRRTWRFCKREPAMATLALVVVALAVGGPALAFHEMRRSDELERLTSLANDEANRANDEATRANAASVEARQNAAEKTFETAIRNGQRGDWQTVLRNLDFAEQQGYPDRIAIRLLRIQALQALGRTSESRAELARLIGEDLGAHEAKGLLLRGEDLLLQGSVKEGRSLIERALTLELDDASRKYAESLVTDNPAESIALLKKATSLDPYHHAANGRLLFALVIQGERETARAKAEALRILYPEDASFRIVLAWIAVLEENDQEVARQFQEIRKTVAPEAVAALQRSFELLENLGSKLSSWGGGPDLELGALMGMIPQQLDQLVADSGAAMFLRSPPAMRRFYRTIQMTLPMARFVRAPAIAAFERAIKENPEGTLFFILALLKTPAVQDSAGIMKNARQFADARDAYLAAARHPAMLPSMRKEALFGAAMSAAAIGVGGDEAGYVQAAEIVRQRRALGVASESQAVHFFHICRLGNAFDMAELLLQDLKRSDPEDPRWTSLELQLASTRGNYRQTLELADAVLAEHPDNSQARQYRDGAIKELQQLQALLVEKDQRDTTQ